MARPRHFAGIDVVRFGAALLVMVLHLSHDAWVNRDNVFVHILAPPAGSRPPAFGFWLGSFGWVGVEIFFVISGLVIANSAAASTPIAFAKSRIYRLYPAVWLCATMSAAVLLCLGMTHHLLVHYVSAVTLFPLVPAFNVYWTLGVEIAFYAIVFLWKWRLPDGTLHWLAVGLLAWSGLYLVLRTAGWHGLPSIVERLSLLRHGVFFALGIFLWDGTGRRLSATRTVAALAALAACLLEIVLKEQKGLFGPAVAAWLVAVALIVLSTRTAAWPRSEHGADVLRNLGLMTYPLYLLHVELGGACVRILLQLGLPSWISILSGMVAAIAAAYVVIRFGERPVRRALRRRLEKWEDAFVRGRASFASLYRSPPTIADGSAP